MAAPMSCDCGWSGAVSAGPEGRLRCPDCHAPLLIPPLPPDPLAAYGPAPVEEPSATVRLARRRRQQSDRDEDAASQATAEVDDDASDAPLTQQQRQRYRPQLLLSPRAAKGFGLLLIGSVVLVIELSRDRIPIFALIFLCLGVIKLFLALRGAEEE